MYVDAELTISGSQPDYQTVEVPGRDGSLIISNQRFKSFVAEIPVFYFGKFKDIKKNIDKAKNIWFGDTALHYLTFSSDPGYTYEASFLDTFEVKKTASELSQVVKFTIMPYKYVNDGLTKKVYSNNDVLNNPGNIVAKPNILIKGSGNGSISFGNGKVNITNLDTSLTMDSKYQTIQSYDGRSIFSQMSGDFLGIDVGNRTLTYDGGITSVQIMPRWAVRI